MKYLCLIICVFKVSIVLSQIEEKPLYYKKINFVYETKSNYLIDEQVIYTDTLLIKLDFPGLKYSKVNKLIGDKLYNCFVELNNLEQSDLKKLCSILYHTNQKYIGIYDTTKDETTFKVERSDELTKYVFKNILKERYINFFYKIKINYGKNKINFDYPRVNYVYTVAEKLNKILFENELIGTYKKKIENLEFENIVLLNTKLDSKIMPDEIFSNNNAGVEIIKKIRETTILKSVSYN